MEEAHPIPQNVTSFEFHLVGDMTLKQFGYLAAGLGSAYLTFVIFFPIAPIVAIPFIIIFAILGAAYAFVPILDRPLDHWTKAFFQAIYAPTRGNWKSPQDPKIKISPDNPIFKGRLETYLANLKTPTPSSINLEEKPIEPTLNKDLTIRLGQDLNSKPLSALAQESKKMTEPIKIKLTKEEPLIPHSVEPIKTPIPMLKSLKITPENNLPSQTVRSVQQDIQTQSKMIDLSPPAPVHQSFTPTNIPTSTESQLDFSPSHNPAYQHLQFVYEAPILKNESKNSSGLSPQTIHTNIPSQPKIEFSQPAVAPNVQPNVSSLFTSVSLPNQTIQPNPIKINPANFTSINQVPQPKIEPPAQHIPVEEEFPLHPILHPSSHPQITPPATPKPAVSTSPALPSSEELNKLVELAREARTLQVKLAEAEKRIKDITINATNTDVTKQVSGDKFDQVYSKLQNLITQTDSLNKEAAEVHKVIPPTAKASPVKVIEPIKTQTTQPILTSQPNVINGIVTDSAGNFLEGVIIIIHDKDNLPVRALKSNKIGQFTGTTPLPGGVYTITLEKEHLEFDTLEVNLNGEIIPPLQVSAKVGGAVAHA